jgi:ribosomal protein S18 acetylase RimI-like enzyme
MSAHRDLTRGDGRLRIATWRGDATTAYLTPARGRPGAREVQECVAGLGQLGFVTALTAALGPADQAPFLAAGFEVHERLHLLARDLHDLPPAPPVALRRGRRRDRPAVLEVDGRAFSAFWRLDDAGLDEALAATPSSRFRIADDPDDPSVVAGYAVTGRAGRRGFLQRLAVDPGFEGRGLGRALVLDGLGWLRRRGVERVVVNTQEANGRALTLYEQLGFRRQHAGLAVLRTNL